MNGTTKKLYYTDTHMVDFTATVLSCEKEENGTGCLVILDQTSFFPKKADKSRMQEP